MFRPEAKWVENGDCDVLMWGHIKVGEVTVGSHTWYAYYHGNDGRFKTLRDFPAPDLARDAVEKALEAAARGEKT